MASNVWSIEYWTKGIPSNSFSVISKARVQFPALRMFFTAFINRNGKSLCFYFLGRDALVLAEALSVNF